MAATHAEASVGEMEALFRPSTRYRDLDLNLSAAPLPRGWTEVELLPGLTTENVLATCTTWDAFRRFTHEKVVWMAPGVILCITTFVMRLCPYVLLLGRDPSDLVHGIAVHVTPGTPATAATATCDLLLRLFATSEHPVVHIRALNEEVPPPLPGAGMSLFFQEIQSCLRKVTFQRMALNADHIHALATESRPGMQVILLNVAFMVVLTVRMPL
jgi:hypothetical protein